MSIDEEKKSIKSETNSHASGNKSNASSSRKTSFAKKEKSSKVDKLSQKYKIKYESMKDVDYKSSDEEIEIDHKDNKKKMVHFEEA